MKNEIKELKAELLKVFSKFEENECEPKFEVGKWYKLYELDLLVLITEVSGITVRYIGFITPKRFEKNWFHIDYNGILATEQEVLTAFTNYFRSQGWVSGKTKFKSARHGNKYIYNEPLILLNGSIGSNPLGCLFDSDTLTLATKVEEEKIMVDGKEVKILDKRTFKIGDYYFSKDAALELRTLNPIFQKILDKLNEK